MQLTKPPVLSKPFAVTEHDVGAVLIREENNIQHPVYYISKRFIEAEGRYPLIEKLTYCLILETRKLRPYFQGHSVQVYTNQPLSQILQKLDASGLLLKWVVELGQYEITFQPRTAIKGQALTYFVAEFTGKPESVSEGNPKPFCEEPSITGTEEIKMIATSPNLMTPLEAYLNTGELPDNRNEARKMRRKAAQYIIVEGIMYRRGFSMPLLRCLIEEEASRLLSKVHDGFCGNHAVGKSLSKKSLRQGYFWPIMIENSKAYVKKCDKC
ncbi:uncharacterized protein LOC133033435 [Cannabis sativa]|uniref:uncharacterized protein LOC133033435 n=1 Tax=Cannabis sativa TaxID=3483 RepID=UPI0029C9E2AE|nr:uncharacterized protein LOC133033435 [Cannabis sativa]